MTAHRASEMFRTLAAEGAEEEESQRSGIRKAGMIATIGLLMIAMPLLWSSAASAGGDAPAAVLTKSGPGSGGDDSEDNSGPGEDDDDTRGDTGTDASENTGAETVGNSDVGGQNTGKSTVGETDPGDKTGKTEQTQGTGAETKGNTDNGQQDTGKSTVGETDPGDNTGKTERR